jgi:hypothetical protein
MPVRAHRSQIAPVPSSRASSWAGRAAVSTLRPSLGNQTVQNLLLSHAVQAKLTVSQPGDLYEQEADQVADEVMRMPEPGAPPITPLGTHGLQKKCAACESGGGTCAGCSEEEETVQRKAETTGPALTPDASPVPHSGGQPLPAPERSFFESRFGRDFSRVRVHTGAEADTSARSFRALAYTHGSDIVFRSGQYGSGTTGQRLLAHELTHVVQQTGLQVPPLVQRQAAGGGGGGGAAEHRFTAEGVAVVVRRSCSPATFGSANVEAATRTALNAIFNTDCIEATRRRQIQRNLRRNGLDLRCRRSANLENAGACAEATGFFIPANIISLGSSSFAGHPDSAAGCQPLESTILHEIVHITRGFEREQLPLSCEASCFGAGGGDPDLCQNIDVFGRRIAP